MNAIIETGTVTQAARLEALLRASKAISSAGDRQHNMEVFVRELHSVVNFKYLFISNCAEDAGEVKWMLEANGRRSEHAEVAFPLQDCTGQWVHQQQRELVIADWRQERRFPRMREFLGGLGIVSTCTLPLVRPDRRIGVLEFGSSLPNAYGQQDEMSFLSVVADQVALALRAGVNPMSSVVANSRLQLLLELTNSVVSTLEIRDVLRAACASVRRVMNCHGVGVMLPDGAGKHLRGFALDVSEGSSPSEDQLVPIEGTPQGKAFQTGTAVVVEDPSRMKLEFTEHAVQQFEALREEVASGCFIPLISRNGALGVLAVGELREHPFDNGDFQFLKQIANQVAIAVENALAYGEIADLKDKLSQEKLYLEDEIRGEMDFEGIIGQSSALRHVLKLVETVAPSDSTVLLLGETGTGKELVARAIHDRSRRKGRTFVKLNCAAIPTGLLESELFGHERGAFTGAISQTIGRLELADQGTLFLDEVGDIPIEIQPKLLRALQEREFERLGSTRTKAVDVRLVAATNRDLEQMIENREFRSDLYYRLNVFPIRIPPLRERPEDIPLLVRHFSQKYGHRMEKDIKSIPAAALKKLSSWSWPGNIRELENFIERSVILTQGPVLQVPVGELNKSGSAIPLSRTVAANERDHILRILKETKGRLAGPKGAAARLGIKRTTLQSRLKRLGIEPRKVG
jgi:formate hydrogenlyase transcriptional activator